MCVCEASIVAGARRGDEAAFAQLVDRYQAPLFKLCVRLLGEAGAAEDATQETFLRVYLHLESYDPHRGFKNWLFAVGAHYCIDRLRRRRLVCQPWESECNYPDALNFEPPPSPEQAALQSEGQHETQAWLASLAPQDRAVIVMHYWGNMSYAEMAAATGSSLGAVKSRLHRARGKLSKTLGRGADCRQRLTALE